MIKINYSGESNVIPILLAITMTVLTIILYALIVVVFILLIAWFLQFVTGFPAFDLLYTCDVTFQCLIV